MANIKLYNMSRPTFILFRLLPGIIAILLVTAPFWTSILGIVDVLLLYLAFIATYLLYKSSQTAISNTIGYGRMKRDTARDWARDLQSLPYQKLPNPDLLPPSIDGLYHLIFIPIYKEPEDLLEKTLSSIAAQDYPWLKNVILVPAVEERAGPEQKKLVEKLKKKYKHHFKDIWDFYHPFGIEGEVIGDACANLRWAGIKASEKLAETGIPSKHVIFTKFDSDSRLHTKFLSALTHWYLSTPKRYNTFYGPAVLIYSNNFWNVPAISRVFFSAMTPGVINEWVAERHMKQTFSCYSANFRLLEASGFWDASTGAEDTYFFWNAYLYLNGDFIGQPFFLPVTMDCVQGTTLWSSITSLYKQQLRWGWGVLIMPIALQGMSWNKKIGIQKKFNKFAVLFRAYNFTLTSSVLLTLTMPILTLINTNLEFSSISYNLPRTISILLTCGLVFQIPNRYFIWRYYGSPPANRPLIYKIWWWTFEPFLMFINIWTYYFIPRVQAIYEMTTGKSRKKFLVAIEARSDPTAGA